MAACLYPLNNRYWRESKAEDILRAICVLFGVDMLKLAEDDGEVVIRTRLVAKIRGE